MTTHRTALILLLMLLASPVLAQEFDDTHDDQTPHRIAIALDATTTTAVTVRQFNTTEPADVRVALLAAPPSNHSVSLAFRAGDGSFDVVEPTATNTDPTPPYHITDEGTFRATVTLPAPAAREEGLVVLRYSISLNTTAGTPGNGGQQVPSILHTQELLYYNATTDTDGDGMLDECEELYFSDLDEDGPGDFDGDDISNEEECSAGSDPTNAGSIPPQSLGGASGGHFTDRDAGNAVAAMFLSAAVVLVVVLLVASSTVEKSVTLWSTVGVFLVLGIFLVLGAMDQWVPGMDGWDWWSRAHVPWQEWVLFGTVATAIMAVGIAAAIKLPQKYEWKAGVGVFAGIVAAGGLSFLLFHVFDVPLPF